MGNTDPSIPILVSILFPSLHLDYESDMWQLQIEIKITI